jgi:hypothetical protein
MWKQFHPLRAYKWTDGRSDINGIRKVLSAIKMYAQKYVHFHGRTALSLKKTRDTFLKTSGDGRLIHVPLRYQAYCPHITSWSPQGIRALRQCTVPTADVMFVTIQRENILPSKKKTNKAVTMLKLPDDYSYAMNHYVSLSLTNRKSSSTCMLCTPLALH